MHCTRLLLLWVVCFLSLQELQAQTAYEMTFDRVGQNDVAIKTIEFNGTLFIIGTTENGAGAATGQDGFVRAVNPTTKETIWSRTYDISDSDQFACAMIDDSRLVIGGSIGVTGNTRRMWVLSIDLTAGNQGNVLMSTTFSSSARCFVSDIQASVMPDANGNPTYLVTGPFNSYSSAYAARINNQGAVIWSNTYTANKGATHTLEEAPNGIIYLGGSGIAAREACLLELDPQGGLLQANLLQSTNFFNYVIRDMVWTDRQTLALYGEVHLNNNLSGITRPIWVEVNPFSNPIAVQQAVRYHVGSIGFTRADDIEAVRDNGGVIRSYVLNIQNRGANQAGRFLQVDLDGEPMLYTRTRNGSIGNSIVALSDGSLGLTGAIIESNTTDERGYFIKTGTDAWYACGDTTDLEHLEDLVITSIGDASYRRQAVTEDQQLDLPITSLVNWEIDTTCCNCCAVAQGNDYVQLDPDNPDSRLAGLGIVRFNNTRLYIMNNGDYNRMPARMRFAENVILYVRTPANSPTPTTMDITNADLVFNHNSGIVVETASKIIGNNAVLRPCDEEETWGGIQLEGRDTRPTSVGPSYVETNISLRECTFVNADFGISMVNIIEGTITGNLFQNCRHGIAAVGLDYQVAITNNTFKIDDKAINLTYNATLRGNPWFQPYFFMDVVSRYTLEHVGIGYYSSSGIVGVSNSIISQNNFINGLTLNLDSQPRFNGVVLHAAGTIDIADNRFINNDMGVVTHYSQLISVEHNLFEVTRRSAVDENFYQVVNFAPSNSSPSSYGTILIKGNTFRNSADMTRLSPMTTLQNTDYLTEGSGAIYNFGGVGGAVKIIDNEISGFQVGIYTEQGKVDLITNNKIEADVYGIYAQGSDGLFGCNEITMDLEANVVADGGVVGIRVTPNTGTVTLPTHVFGNCIKNTDRAVFFSALPSNAFTTYTGLGHAQIQNNYLFNYTEAGLFVQNYNNAPGQADLVRRNAFISNQENGIGAVGTGVFDIMTSNSGTTNNTLTVGDNYYGSDNMANVLAFDTDPSNGTALTAITVGGTDAKPFTACGGMDADITTLTANEQDWLTRCGNENFTGNIIISQRTATTGVILTANYSTILTKIGAEDLEQAANLVTTHMHWLSNDLEVQQLYNSAQQLPLNNQQRQWLDAAYYSRLENWTAAKQALNNIMVDASEEARLTIAKATVEVAQQATLQDATLIAALKEVASELGAYRHEARELLNTYTNETYEFSYNPVEIYTKTAKTTNNWQAASTNSMRLLPNPASTTIQVQLMDKKANWTTAELYDIHGRLIQSQTIRSYSLQFDVQELTPSVYFITLKTANGEQTTEKFVKQ
ncbi:MAG: T9SS type A sorting domain-containing protein [Aureispira sp.]